MVPSLRNQHQAFDARTPGPKLAASDFLAARPEAVQSAAIEKTKFMKIIIAADPFALNLKKPIVAYLKETGHEVIDLGATEEKTIPYYESCVTACRALQEGKGDRAILMCGTGMGMSVIANRFKGITAAVVESVFAARMCRAINNANVLCLGSMIWGDWMAKDAVETFLTTNLADGLPQFADFLKDACRQVEAITPADVATS